MLCTEYNHNPHPYHHTLPSQPHHGFHTPVPFHYQRPISPKHHNAGSVFIRRSRVPYNVLHDRTTSGDTLIGGSTGIGGGGSSIKYDEISPSNTWPMKQLDPRRRILQEELQHSSGSASPESSPSIKSAPQSRRPSIQRSATEMPYITREPEEEAVDRARKHRHDHVHHHHHHHHHHNNNSKSKSRSRERSYNREENRHTASSMEETYDDRSSPRRPSPRRKPAQQADRPQMIKRSNTSAGSFASGLFKKKIAAKEGGERRGSVDRDIDRPRPERRDSIRSHREVTPNRASGDYKRGSRESSVNREYAKHHQKDPKGDAGRPGLQRSRTLHHREHRDADERHNSSKNYDRHSGEDRSKAKIKREGSDREEKLRAEIKPKEVDLSAKAKEKARMEAAHKKKHRRNVLSEILIHEQKLLEEQNLPPNRVAPQPPKHLTDRAAPPSRAPPQPPKLVECNTCLSDDIPEDQAAKLSCGHIFCNECLVRLFNLSLTDPAHMPPRCCQPEAHIPLKHVDKLLSTKTKIRWNKKYQEFTTANRMYCPQVDCGEWIRPKDFFVVEGVKIGKCSRCKTDICGLCGLKEHGKEECPKDEELNNVREMGKELGWQRCYNCRAMVELEKGCNHMTCRCTAEFCMPCGAKWKTCSCPWFNFEPGEDDAPVPQFDENGRLQDEDLAWEERGRQNDDDERLARQLALDFEEMDNMRERNNNGGGGNLWAPLIAGAIGGLLTRTRNLEGAAMERLRRAYATAIEDDFGWGDSSDESEDERPQDGGFWRIGGPHAIHL